MDNETPFFTLEEAAEFCGMSPDQLMVSRARGLSPGTLGFKPHPSEPLLWLKDDLLPAPKEKLQKMADMVEVIAENTNQCSICGFQAKSKGGLTTHKRRHE